MQLPDFLELDADDEIRLKGHRIRLIDVAARYAEGLSAEGIFAEAYPTLNLPLIHKTIAFYLENRSVVDEMVAENDRAMAELEANIPRRGPTPEELRRRMAAKYPAITAATSPAP